MNGEVEPIVEWIGDIAIRHGERDDSEMCLCGHPEYFTCPGWLFEPGIGDLTLTRNDDGTITAASFASVFSPSPDAGVVPAARPSADAGRDDANRGGGG